MQRWLLDRRNYRLWLHKVFSSFKKISLLSVRAWGLGGKGSSTAASLHCFVGLPEVNDLLHLRVWSWKLPNNMYFVYLHNRLTDKRMCPHFEMARSHGPSQCSREPKVAYLCMGYVVLRGTLLTTSAWPMFGLEHAAALVSGHKSTTVLLQVTPALVLYSNPTSFVFFWKLSVGPCRHEEPLPLHSLKNQKELINLKVSSKPIYLQASYSLRLFREENFHWIGNNCSSSNSVSPRWLFHDL